MIRIILKPLEGIDIEGKGSINFGQTASDVIKMLGEPNRRDIPLGSMHYHALSLRIDLDNDKTVEFIDLYSPALDYLEPSNAPQTAPYIYGINPFEVVAKEAMKVLADNNKGEVDDTEAPYIYTYIDSGIAINFTYTLEDVEEEIAEAREYEEYEESMEEGMRRQATHICMIGIGREDYFDERDNSYNKNIED